MQAFLVSTGTVALAEMGGKTQLLSLVLAARFRKPWPIVAATLVNHALAGPMAWVTQAMGPGCDQPAAGPVGCARLRAHRALYFPQRRFASLAGAQ
jgi:hypothetical protein